MNITDQKPRIATAKHCSAPWGGRKNGERFRCYLCGQKFRVGDRFRWVYAGHRGLTNLLVCEACDGTNEEVLAKWADANIEAETRFWWIRR